MADTKLSDLTTAVPAKADIIYLVDVSDTTDNAAGSSRKCTLTSLRDNVGIPYTLFDHYADGASTHTDGTEDDLYSDSVAASTLATNGDKLEAEYAGTFVSSATATRRLKIYFGGTAIFDTGALTVSLAAAWVTYVTLIRVSATVVRYSVTLTTEGAALAAYTAVGELTGLTLSNSNTLKITGIATGTGAASGDITAKLGWVGKRPVAA